MNGYLNTAIEWAAKRLLVQAVQRMSEMVVAAEQAPLGTLPAIVLPTIPQIEYQDAVADEQEPAVDVKAVVVTTTPAKSKRKS